MRAELIYIDASHDEYHVYGDLVHYWQLLRPGGIMFGDDYGPDFFPGLVRAVDRFASDLGLSPEVIDRQYWLLRKAR